MRLDLNQRMARLMLKLPRIERILAARESLETDEALVACRCLLDYYSRHGGKPCRAMLEEIEAVVAAVEGRDQDELGTRDQM